MSPGRSRVRIEIPTLTAKTALATDVEGRLILVVLP